jgi:serine/threonine-protein kinase
VPERFLGLNLGGRYHLTRLIGAGAYAWVYEATDRELEIPVAVKVLRPEHSGQSVIETRFRREATTAARLRDVHIVTIRDVGVADGVTYVVMDLVPGSLSRRLRVQTALPEPEVVRIGLDVAAALATAHTAGVIHRDIKPDNILLGASGEAIVCDFGLARALTAGADLSATNQVVGTPHYFSPEQARGEPLDGRSDLYALGVTLFRAATGRLPFEGDDWYAVARQHVDAPAPDAKAFNAELSDEFAALLADLLAKDPAARPATAAALIDRLAQLPSAPATGSRLALRTGGTTAVHPIVGTLRPARGRRAAWALFALTVVLALLWVSRGAPSPDTIWARASTAAVADTLPEATAPTEADSLVADSTTDSSRSEPDAPFVPDAPGVSRRASLAVTVDEEARLVVNGRELEGPPYHLPRVNAGRYVIEARLVSGPGVDGCPFSAHVDTVVVRAGETRTHTMSLGRCTRLLFEVSPPEADVTLEAPDGTLVSVPPADARAGVLLRAGPWRIRARAPRCAPYEAMDTLRAGLDTVRFKLIC